MTSSAQADLTIRHFRYIDALRGLAILGVIALHTSQVTVPLGHLAWMLHFGANGVQLFFTISAFTLVRSMNKRERVERYPLRNYFLRRLFRIAPTFYLFVAIYSLIAFLNPAQTFAPAVSKLQLLSVVTFTNGWRVDTLNQPVIGQWSIAVEMTFYLLLPLILPYIKNFRHAVIAWWISLGIFAVSFAIGLSVGIAEGFDPHTLDSRFFAATWFPSQLSTFIGGIGLFYIIRERIPFRRYILPYAAGLAGLLFLRVFYRDTYLHPIYSVGFMALAAFLSHRPIGLLVNRFTIFLGKVSFSAYLCHPLLLHLLLLFIHRALPHAGPKTLFAATLPLELAIVCPVSWLLWRFCETPFMNLGHQIIGALEQRETAALPLTTNS